jgi:hypothetical protein
MDSWISIEGLRISTMFVWISRDLPTVANQVFTIAFFYELDLHEN